MPRKEELPGENFLCSPTSHGSVESLTPENGGLTFWKLWGYKGQWPCTANRNKSVINVHM